MTIGGTCVGIPRREEARAVAPESKTRFRGDIQGLRAIAVGAVALDHAEVGPFSGGFVGVDVFFVISGFLITQLLLAEWQRTGSISLTGFYSRRARRILPAATLVLVATVLAAAILISFVRVKTLIAESVWATFFAANVKFGREGTDYFSAGDPPSALQHYWSLAVEEQFYLAWPLALALLLGAFAMVKSRRIEPDAAARRSALKRVGLGLVVISGLSLAWCLSLTHDNATAAYFSTPARVWELGLGAACAVAVPVVTGFWLPVRSLMSWAGLAMIVVAVFTFTSSTVFPGAAALLPTVGAALVLLGGCGWRSPGIQALLENKPMRVVGDWSYSLYLWHWPVLVLAAEHAGHPLSQYQNLGLLALALVLSGLTYAMVENPFRRSRKFARRPRRTLLLYPAAVGLTLLACTAANAEVDHQIDEMADQPAISTTHFGADPASVQLSPDPTLALVEASALAARNHLPIPGHLSPSLLDLGQDRAEVGDCDYTHNVDRLCERGVVGSEHTIVLFGDSHARHWIPAFDQIASDNGYSAYYLVKPGCNGAQMSLNRSESSTDNCAGWREWAIDKIKEISPEWLVISGEVPDRALDSHGAVVEDDAGLTDLYRQGLIETLKMVGPSVQHTAIIGDVPGLDEYPSDCLSRRGNDLGDCAFAPSKRARLELLAAQQAASASGALFVNPVPWFCADGLCPSVIGSTVAYRDVGHISPEYAVQLVAPLDAKLGLVPQSAG